MNKSIKPSISINLRKPLIRISKDTISSLGNPEYILLLVNPNDKSLGILPSSKSDSKAHHLSKYSHRKCLELYSKSLITNLMELCPQWNKAGTYKMEGLKIDNKNIIKFNMNDATEIRGLQ